MYNDLQHDIVIKGDGACESWILDWSYIYIWTGINLDWILDEINYVLHALMSQCMLTASCRPLQTEWRVGV